MNIRRLFVSLGFILSAITFSFSQNASHKIDVNRDIDIVRVYEQVVREGYGTPFIYRELARSYYFRSNYDKAVVWFQKLFASDAHIDAELTHQYGQSIKALSISRSEPLVQSKVR